MRASIRRLTLTLAAALAPAAVAAQPAPAPAPTPVIVDAATRRAIVAALRYLDGTDAVIIDLRANGGGSPRSVNFLLSHFTTPDTVASLHVSNRSGHEEFTRYTLAQVPGPRRPNVPLYVLTSGVTASAAEDFAFVAKNLGRATLVGGTTAGAGRNN